MVAYSFNAQQHTPQYGGGGGLPAGPNGENVRYKVMLTGSAPENTTDQFGNVKGGYLAFELQSVEGPTQGQKQIDRINVHHTNPKVVEIANNQLSAYCHVIGKFQFQDTQELHGIPFMAEIGLQKEPNPNKYTEVKALFDINGNEPGKAGAGPQANTGQPPQGPPSGPPAAGVQATSGGWGGAPQGQGQQGQQPGVDSNVPIPGQQQSQPPQQQSGFPPQQGQGQPPQQQGGWGAPQQGGQPPRGQQPPQGGGQPGWGQPAANAPGWGPR